MTWLGDSEMASTSGFDDEMLANYGILEGSNILSLSGLAPMISTTRNNQEIWKNMKGGSQMDRESADRLPEQCRRDFSSFHSFRKRGSYLRRKCSRGFSIKPSNSLESCLTAQLYKEHTEMEEYVLSTFPSPSRPTVRPLVVTDGNRVISRADSYNVRLESGDTNLRDGNGFCSDGREMVLVDPPRPQIRPLERKEKRGKGRVGKLSSSKTKDTGKNFMSRGSADRMFIFCLGISIGLISTVLANKREIDKLNELLKQTENLVQDLQEELEMKDSLTVKELPNEDDESQETNDYSFCNGALTSFSTEMSYLTYRDKRSRNLKHEPDENSEFMSKIEAELEAELETLELNMHASSLEGRLSGLEELDPDFVGNIVQGELRTDMVKGGAGFREDSDTDVTGTSTTQNENMNYAVSPRELSLRLHEVIQSRLEGRIVELESELQNSQKRVNLLESKHQMNIGRNFSDVETRTSSQECLAIKEGNSTARALFLNLSGDALDAYNEAYEEFLGIPGTDEEVHTPVTVHNSNQISSEILNPDWNLFSSRNGCVENGSFQHVNVIKEKYPTPKSLLGDKTWERFSSSKTSNEVGEFEEENGDDENDDEEDEDGKTTDSADCGENQEKVSCSFKCSKNAIFIGR